MSIAGIIWRLCIVLAAAPAQTGPASSQDAAKPPPGVQRLVSAYPETGLKLAGDTVVWPDGTAMQVDDGLPAKAQDQWLARPDIKDMFRWAYPADQPIAPPPEGADPGRARHAAFFNKLYGDCTKGSVEDTLVQVAWVPRHGGGVIRFNPRHGAARHLAAVSSRLDALPKAFGVYLKPIAGTYVCRSIAGTNHPSAHGWGIAIDIAVARSDYWRWSKRHGSDLLYRNRIPGEIVAAFEAEGFIWGGRWSHFDTMHFEYRPEFFPRLP